MEEAPLDFMQICRTCKKVSENMMGLLEDNETTETRIDEMLMACASLQVEEEDELPLSICGECLEKLESAYLFKQLCEESDSSLRDYLKNCIKLEQSDADLTTDLLNDLQKMLNFKEKTVGTKIKEEKISRSDLIEVKDDNHLILTCRECFKVFTTIDGLRCHKRVHSGSLFKCKVCPKQYTRLNHLQRHESTHGRRKVHVCKICNKTLTRYEHLKRHLITHLKEKPFSCEKCNRGFNRSEHLLTHAERCKGDRIHICNVCNKGFNRADSLEVHSRIHANITPVLPTLDNLDNIEEHYMEMDYDEADNSANTYEDNDFDDDFDENETDCLEPKINLTINQDENLAIPIENDLNAFDEDEEEDKFKLDNNDDPDYDYDPDYENPSCNDDEIEGDDEEIIKNNEDTNKLEEIDTEIIDEISNYVENDSDSENSEYTPTKTSPKKRGRGRPRKNSVATKVKKSPTSGKRGRPSKKFKRVIKEETIEPDEDGRYHCGICKEDFETVILLEKHGETMHGKGEKALLCKICTAHFSRATHLRRHMLSHSEERPYECDVCSKRFNRRDHLTQHKKLHSREQQYECDICHSMFSRRDHLAKHINMRHNPTGSKLGVKQFKCASCPKAFTTEKYMLVHMKIHTGEVGYKCKICNKTFLSKSHLNEHQKFHNENSKKFLCSECGQRFIRNDYLVIHMRRHRGEKPFKCKFCGKGFPRTTDLTVHERYHTGEKTHLCVICGRGFGRAYNLTVHMRTHTGEKPYQCTYCDAAFAQGNDLKAHVRRHTGERFQCELCSETFLMGYLLTQHKRSAHGLNVVSNIRRLQPVNKDSNPDDPPPITIPLPIPMVPSAVLNAQLSAHHLTVTQIQHNHE